MTPFGELMRELRAERGVTQKEMAAQIGVSAAYLSALEHGHRGTVSFPMRQKIIAWANIIWDEAEALERIAELSDPRPVLDTTNASARTTLLANHLARRIGTMDDETVKAIFALLEPKPTR